MLNVECVCGCGTEVPKRLIPTNLVASMLMFELAEFDKQRLFMIEGGAADFESSPLHQFIDDGADCYQRSLQVLHGELLHSTPRETNRWLKFARKSRKKLAKEWPMIQGQKQLEPTEEDVRMVNRLHPELSHTGRITSESSEIEQLTEPTTSSDEQRDGTIDAKPEITLSDLERKYGSAADTPRDEA